MTTTPTRQATSSSYLFSEVFARRLESIGAFLLRYGLVFLLFLFGAEKWTAAEAQGIQSWMSHSPIASSIYHVMSVQHGSELIGAAELVTTPNDADSKPFLMKDILLLGAVVWTGGEAMIAAKRVQLS